MTYFDWLRIRVDFINSDVTYVKLLRKLFSTEFTWKHPMDRNRAKDGIALRESYPGRPVYFHSQCSVLEFLIALSERMHFIFDDYDVNKTKEIFWHLLHNLDLNEMNDNSYEAFGGDAAVEHRLNRFMDREYAYNGEGGLFPMLAPKQDQREVEIWYQMNQYYGDPNSEELRR